MRKAVLMRSLTLILACSSLQLACLRKSNGGNDLAAVGDPVTLAGLKAKTQKCNAIDVGLFAEDRGMTGDIPLCQLPGAVFWKADFDIDCDGGTSANCKSDPYYQASTSAVDSQGRFVDASKLPFVVLPLNSGAYNASRLGLKVGSVVAVIYQDKLVFAAIADQGPKGVIGEGSEMLASILGIPNNSRSGGVSGKVVTFIAFTGADAMVSPIESHGAAQALGQRKANQLLGQHTDVTPPPAPLIPGDNALVSGDKLFIRDASGNKIAGRWVDDGDSIKITKVNYDRQLLFVEYPTPSGARSGWVTNATKVISYEYEDQYVNGSTREPVYDESGTEIGAIFPGEKATPLYRGSNGMLYVVYDTDKGPNTKGGFVKYNGGFNRF